MAIVSENTSPDRTYYEYQPDLIQPAQLIQPQLDRTPVDVAAPHRVKSHLYPDRDKGLLSS